MPITWRNVAGPNFNGVANSIRTFSDLIGRATDGAREAIQGEDQRLTNLTNADYMTEIMKFKTPGDLEAALAADPRRGMDRRRLSAETLKSGAAMVDTLLSRDTTRLQNEGTELLNDARQIELARKQNEEKFRPQLNEYERIVQTQGRAAGNKYLADNPGLAEAVNFSNTLTNGLNNTKSNVDIDGALQDQYQSGVEFEDTQENRARFEQSTGLAQIIRGNNATGAGVRDSLAQIEDPIVRAMTAQQLQGDFPGLYGDVFAQGGVSRSNVGMSGGSAGSISGTRVSGSLTDTSGTFEGALSRLWETEGGYANNPRDNGGETMYGITAKTARANGYTGPMRDLPRSVAERIYRDEYWAPIERAGIPAEAREAVFDFGVNAGPETALKMWRQSGGNLDKFNELRLNHYRNHEDYDEFGRGWEARVVRTTPAPAPTFMRDSAIDIGGAVLNSQENNVFGTNGFIERLGKNPKPRDAAMALVEGGFVSSMPEILNNDGNDALAKDMLRIEKRAAADQVEKVLRDIVKRGGGKISYADAADIYSRAPGRDPEDYLDRNGFFSSLTNSKSSGFEDYVDAEIELYKSGKKENAARRVADRREAARQLQAAQAAVVQERNVLQMLQSSGRANPREIQAQVEKINRAQEAYEAVLAKYGPDFMNEDEKSTVRRATETGQRVMGVLENLPFLRMGR